MWYPITIYVLDGNIFFVLGYQCDISHNKIKSQKKGSLSTPRFLISTKLPKDHCVLHLQ